METEPTNPITEHAAQMAAVPDEAADIASKLVEQIVSGHLDSALEAVERGDGAFEDYAPHPYSIEGDARAIVAAVTPILTAELRARVGVLEGQLATARGRHQPVRRYHGPDTDDRSFETPEEAAEYDDVPPSAVRHFDICKTCGDMEVHDDEWRAYEWSLWPCKEAVALGLDGGDPDGR